jgi:uncharacterized membrane protein YiaA
MKELVAKLLILGMAVTFFLLAYQAEPITAGFGYFFGTVITLAFLLSFSKVKRL